MIVNPDNIVYWQWGVLHLNATIVSMWLVMGLLVIGSWLFTRALSSDAKISYGQSLLEVLVTTFQKQIREISQQPEGPYLPFIGTLFLFIAFANLLTIVPGFLPPTASLSTTTALALSVFFAVPFYGIARQGLFGYLRHYLQPTPLMLPFTIIGEFSRTIALAIRLFGNVMSSTVIVGIILSVAPFFFPIILQLLGLLTGMVQAYIFAVLAMVFIASATYATDSVRGDRASDRQPHTKGVRTGE